MLKELASNTGCTGLTRMCQQDRASKLGRFRPSVDGINLSRLLPRCTAKAHHASGARRDEGGGSMVWQPSPWPSSSTWMVLCVMPRRRHAVVTSSITTLHKRLSPIRLQCRLNKEPARSDTERVRGHNAGRGGTRCSDDCRRVQCHPFIKGADTPEELAGQESETSDEHNSSLATGS